MEIREWNRVDGPSGHHIRVNLQKIQIWAVQRFKTVIGLATATNGCIPLAFNFWFQKLFFLNFPLCLRISLNINNILILLNYLPFADPLTFLFYQQTVSITQHFAINKPISARSSFAFMELQVKPPGSRLLSSINAFFGAWCSEYPSSQILQSVLEPLTMSELRGWEGLHAPLHLATETLLLKKNG